MYSDDNNRWTGQTYGMINFMVDCIQDGQPEALVIGHNRQMCDDYLFRMTINALERRNMVITSVRKNNLRIEVDGSVIEFMSAGCSDIMGRLVGRIPCWFVDHTVTDMNMLDGKTLDFLKYYPNHISTFNG